MQAYVKNKRKNIEILALYSLYFMSGKNYEFEFIFYCVRIFQQLCNNEDIVWHCTKLHSVIWQSSIINKEGTLNF